MASILPNVIRAASALILCGLAAAGLAYLYPAAAASEPFCDFPGRFNKWLDFRFNGRRFSVPAAYSKFPSAFRGEERTGLILYAHPETFGNLEPPSYYRARAVNGITKYPDVVSMFFRKDMPVEKIAEVSANLGDGLDAWSKPLSVIRDKPLSEYPRAPGPYGLTEIVYKPVYPYLQQTFVIVDGGKMTSMMRCDLESRGLIPQCELVSRTNGLGVSLGFDRTNLSGWEFYLNRTIEFLRCGEERAKRLP